jgi:hypothetical protein
MKKLGVVAPGLTISRFGVNAAMSSRLWAPIAFRSAALNVVTESVSA